MKDYDVEGDMVSGIVRGPTPFAIVILLVLGVAWLMLNVLLPVPPPAG